MPASFRMLLSRGRSGGGALLCLLSGLLPCAGFGDGALLGLLGSGPLLSCYRFRHCMLLQAASPSSRANFRSPARSTSVSGRFLRRQQLF